MRADENQTPLWEKALENYQKSLTGEDDYKNILDQKGTLEELTKYTKILQLRKLPGDSALSSMKRLRPALRFVNDFLGIMSIYCGANTSLAAVIWGNLKMILTLASSGGDTLRGVVDMLEELSFSLPRFQTYKVTMDAALESSLLAVNSEVVGFYARIIYFLRTRKSVMMREEIWAELRGDFKSTTQRIKYLSAEIEKEAELERRLRMEMDKHNQVMEIISEIKRGSSTHKVNRCYYVPRAAHPRFWGRQDALEQVDRALDPSRDRQSLQSFSLYGIGGVGKTQIALQYVTKYRRKFSTIIWIAADSPITMKHSFRDVARYLGIIDPNQDVEDVSMGIKVKNWLYETGGNWLLVFDNADDLSVLKHVWPGGNEGSVLLTTRDSNGAINPALDGFHVKPFDNKAGSGALLNLLGLDVNSDLQLYNAKAITSTLGGLPLALNQIAGFIAQRKLSLKGFIPLYARNTVKIDSKMVGQDGNSHTISTVWQMALDKLSGDAKMLQMLLAFFDPDMIDESVLKEGGMMVKDKKFEFLQDELDLLDAEQPLLQAALIEKNNENNHLSLHRLVQTATIRNMSTDERVRILIVVIGILSWEFPDTYSTDIGHQVSSWERGEKCLPHIDSIVRQITAYKIELQDTQCYGELILRCCWYLYEKEHYEKAQEYLQIALQSFNGQLTATNASAVDLSGLIELDMGNPQKALNIFKSSAKIREAILPLNDPFLAASQVNLGLAYTELGDLEKAYQHLQESIEIRLAANSDRIGNSYSNMSSLLLRMEKADEAEEMLKRCPSLKDFNDETFLKRGNPRFSGDMILLSRIRTSQGRLNDAISLASKALSFRKGILKNRLKISDSLYQVAILHEKQGNHALSIQLLDECASIAENLPKKEGINHLARATYKLSAIFHDINREQESKERKKVAIQLLAESSAMRGEYFDESMEIKPSVFDRLVPWMLW